MTSKEELHRWVDDLSEDHAREVLQDVRASQESDRSAIPEWQKEEILRRKATSLANPGTSVDWETVKREIRSRRVS